MEFGDEGYYCPLTHWSEGEKETERQKKETSWKKRAASGVIPDFQVRTARPGLVEPW